jgi:DNA modification methylase
MVKSNHKTELGAYYIGKCEDLLRKDLKHLKGKVQLILTSPPYPLNAKKSYGNLVGEEYKKWFISLSKLYSDVIAENGSIVIEIGNAWMPERPVQSLLHLESLIGFVNHNKANLRLIQQFVCYNPSRLPSPANWVTINRIRVTDSYTNIWWMAKSDYPKSDNRKVLRPYSDNMKRLLARQSYNSGERPSEHIISEEGFLHDNGGSISHNFFEIEALDKNREVRLPNVFSMGNTSSNDYFMTTCRDRGITPHPARMPSGLAAFFIQFLTDEGDIVLDPFAGSNTTGAMAEKLGRKWVSIDAKADYAEQSLIRLEAINIDTPEPEPKTKRLL